MSSIVLISINPDTPSKGYRLRHRRGKSETLRAQYINTKDVRFGDNLPMLSIRSTMYFGPYRYSNDNINLL
jgi:hypothetical protein